MFRFLFFESIVTAVLSLRFRPFPRVDCVACPVQVIRVNGDYRVGVYAKVDIPRGSELTFDYNYAESHRVRLTGSKKRRRTDATASSRSPTKRVRKFASQHSE